MKRAFVLAVLVACGSTTKPEPALENKPQPGSAAAATAPARGLAFVVVDENSDYMKRVFARVGSARDGAPTDPDAIAAGIRGDIDQWTTNDSGNRFIDYYLVASDRGAIERYLAKLAASDPLYRVPDDRELVFEKVNASWRSYYVFKKREIDHRAVENAVADHDPRTGLPIVRLDFTPDAKRAFEDLTSRIVGKKLATLLDGNVHSAPIVMGTVRGGRISIRVGGSDVAAQEAEAAALVKALTPPVQ
ncbi:MAG: hypothetical protein H0T46_16975 [Deltaproteobacteria bacterium]|nr:hypothetical protein [Deltaproteobacteria bacterium]